MIRANLRFWKTEADLGYSSGFKTKYSWSVLKYIIVLPCAKQWQIYLLPRKSFNNGCNNLLISRPLDL